MRPPEGGFCGGAGYLALGQEPTPKANSDGVGSRPSLQLRQQVPDVGFDRLLGEEQHPADLAVHEAL